MSWWERHVAVRRRSGELVWFDEARAVEALPPFERPSGDLPDTYPFGL